MTLDDALALYPGARTFTFGDGPALSAELLALVRAGRKTATCAKLADYEAGREAFPRIGRTDIALNWDGTPALAIRTVSLKLVRYIDVDEAFALAEGESASLEGWREDHRVYFTRTTGFDPEMELVCERFTMVRDFA